MEVILAKTAGFCFGVKRAVDMVYDLAGKGKIYTYGPIIHNEEVVKDLEKKGVLVIEDEDELKALKNCTLVIRSHGVERRIYELVDDSVEIVDGTCPFVKKIHNIVDKDSARGNGILIIGDKNHAEVKGIMGWCNNEPFVAKDISEIEEFDLPTESEITVVSQTTFHLEKFNNIVDFLKEKRYNVSVNNTICNATAMRQKEAADIASRVDAMIVIGGKNSSNTQKLFEISKKECDNTYYIQTLDDLDLTTIESVDRVGITAGASTPNQIIKEVHGSMADDFGKMLEESFEEATSIGVGRILDVTVISVKEEAVVVGIPNYKADGIITKAEFSADPNVVLADKVKEGDTLEAKVIKLNDGEGQVVLSVKRVAAEKASEELREAFEKEEVVKGVVAEVLKGGLAVTVGEARVFIPASLVSDTFEKDLSKYLGQEIEFKITEFEPKKRRVIGNRKMIVETVKKELREALFAKINVGDVVEGKVKNVTAFGAFIDLGGADGLLHISEMSWGRVDDPKKMFKVGQEVKAVIKEINGEKIALSLKFDDTNPWKDAEEKYAMGTIVTGKVARMTDFGAFVELEPGVDALLHVSQISKEHIEKPSSVLSIGQEIEAKVVDFRIEEHKISLSMKALLPDDEDDVAYSDDVDNAAEDAEE